MITCPAAKPGAVGAEGFDHPQVVRRHCLAHQMMGNRLGALAVCADVLSFIPHDAELLFRKAVVHRTARQPAEAEDCWRRILTPRRPDQFCRVDQGTNGHLTLRNPAVLAEEHGDLDAAEEC
jgi:hypothetical protein